MKHLIHFLLFLGTSTLAQASTCKINFDHYLVSPDANTANSNGFDLANEEDAHYTVHLDHKQILRRGIIGLPGNGADDFYFVVLKDRTGTVLSQHQIWKYHTTAAHGSDQQVTAIVKTNLQRKDTCGKR